MRARTCASRRRRRPVLTEVMGVALTAEEVAALEARNEGWIAGLQLAALSLQDRPDAQRAAFIAAFTGSHRFVMDYLLDEVLARQPPHLQTFLLQTVDPGAPVWSAVRCGGARGWRSAQHASDHDAACIQPAAAGGTGAQQPVHRPAGRRAALVSLPPSVRPGLTRTPDERHDPDAVAALHRRASAWFAGHGLVVEAVQHALAAQDWERAAGLIELHGQLLLARGQVPTVLGWLNTLPETVAQSHPFLDVIHAGSVIQPQSVRGG